MLEKDVSLSIGQRIRRERIYLCLSQAELAEMVKTSTSSIQRWENDKTLPHLYHRKQLCTAFGKRVEEIFSYLIEDEYAMRNHPHRPTA